MRSDWTDRARVLAFDAGPQGMGTSAHGHADALSFVCSADGVDWLIDPGTYVYTASRAWRDFFRSTAAHNTAVVDDQDQAEPVDWFKWRKLPRVHLEQAISSPSLDYAVASHDGYASLPKPVFHKRRILFVKPDYWLISDELTGEGEHQLKFCFHFAPGVSLQPAEHGCLASKGEERFQLLASGPECRFRVFVGEESPIQGWYSRDYGHREPAPVLIAEAASRVPFRIHWLLVPGAKDRLSLREAPSSHGELEIESGCETDFVLASERGHQAGEFSSDAELAVVRQSKTSGRFERILLINGSHIRHEGKDLLKGSRKFAYFSASRVDDSLEIQAEPVQAFRLSCQYSPSVRVNGHNVPVQFSGQEMFFGENN
jgi:hypothetical protein